jgi:hypothetical protein
MRNLQADYERKEAMSDHICPNEACHQLMPASTNTPQGWHCRTCGESGTWLPRYPERRL